MGDIRKEPEKIRQGDFLIRILYRQHHTWQGTVTWVSKYKTAPFKSALELMMLLDAATKSGEPTTVWETANLTQERKNDE